MHYADGTEARIGDIVVGKGYNIRDSAGELKTIIGIINEITPESSTCNCQVVVLTPCPKVGDAFRLVGFTTIIGGRPYTTEIEYGQCDHFNLTTPRVPD